MEKFQPTFSFNVKMEFTVEFIDIFFNASSPGYSFFDFRYSFSYRIFILMVSVYIHFFKV